MLASFQTTERLFFVMEFVSGGDLFHHIAKVPNNESVQETVEFNLQGRFKESRAAFYMSELVLALEFLHGKVFCKTDPFPFPFSIELCILNFFHTTNSQIRDTLLCQSRTKVNVVKWCQKRCI